MTMLVGNTTTGISTPLPSLSIGAFSVSGYVVFLIALAAAIFGLLYVLFKLTTFGLLARATTQNADMVAALGGNPRRIYALTFGLGEVDGQGFLVACLNEPPQRGAFVELAPLAQWIAAVGRLDLDHFGAELGADPRGERAGDQGAELDHLQAGQRFGRMFHAVSVRLQCAHSLEHLPAVRAGAAVG